MQVFILVLGLTLLYLAATNKLYYIVQIILTDTKQLTGKK